jgi:hypothetical protein
MVGAEGASRIRSIYRPIPRSSNFIKLENRTTEIGRGEKPIRTADDAGIFGFSGAVVRQKRPETGASWGYRQKFSITPD